jgi:CheY-like chemotaxis protein
VEVVGSGLEAIYAYEKHKPDLVLMDYWMAKLNGVTACRNILARDPAARVILVSAWSPTSDLSDSGAIAVLSKPVDLKKLQAALDTASQHLSFSSSSAA